MAPPQQGTADSAVRRPPSLGQILLDAGEVRSGDLLKASVIQQREDAPLAEILIARGWLTDAGLRRALARHWRTGHVDLAHSPPDPRMIDALGAPLCLAHGVVPWRRIGGIPFVATCRPEGFEAALALLPPAFAQARMVLTDEAGLQAAILATRRTRLIREAELRTPAALSCRTRDERRVGEVAVLILGALAVGLAAAPLSVLAGLSLLALGLLAAASVMKAAAFAARLRADAAIMAERRAYAELQRSPAQMRQPLPVISVMVPMFREEDIAARLVGRLSALTYPSELTDIVLVVEECDMLTRDALAAASLPRWMRVVVVPDGPLRTKPRALNYAQNFCRGSIIGVWDAEDWPEPEQLHKIARHFAAAPPEVVCLQGVLDFYNPRTNWMARCFTIEYASWFRAILPGMARLGLVVPLGGTTLFFRRDALAEVGGWDAWNVTEDADLGLRLMRHGYRTEMVDTVTHEEANCRPRAWVKQRSRWHKGYFMTWLVHMRRPRALWHDIGPRAFVSFQLQLAGTVVGFLIAPVLWSYWLLCLGLGHPMAGVIKPLAGGRGMALFVGALITAEVVNLVVGAWAVRAPARRHLSLWVPSTWLYFPLGCLAAWKAIYEVVAHPFYWDKTLHGLYDAQSALPDGVAEGAAVPDPLRRPPRARPAVPSADRWPAGSETEPRRELEVVGAIS
ncbi:glycosyltransferase [Paracoccus suum]|uniref:Glycosyltransferase n=1 Tax=Paracoccus suum TaxID=2259340 RepID=A0A344PNP5_9RHOB|nr:glycosyltransferase family 2 protein [Paracoccus suum]AXC51000.1 glycosyltransferase [Paracoccus suum]